MTLPSRRSSPSQSGAPGGVSPRRDSPAGAQRDAALFVQSQALGDPTRYRIFLAIRDAAAPVGVADLTARFGLNHNAIRQHLAKLTAAGLVVDELRPANGRGRPPRLYRLAPGAAERWGGFSPNELLSLMLLDMITDERDVTGGRNRRSDGDGERDERARALAAGRSMGSRLAAAHRPGESTPVVLESVATQLGFEPRREAAGASVSELVLEHCPFAVAAGNAPGVVCTLHRGIAEGVAETVGDGWRVVALEARDPERAGCRLVAAAAS